MAELPFKISELVHLFNRISKLIPSTIFKEDRDEPEDALTISAEGKKRQILEQTRGEVLERIKEAK